MFHLADGIGIVRYIKYLFNTILYSLWYLVDEGTAREVVVDFKSIRFG